MKKAALQNWRTTTTGSIAWLSVLFANLEMIINPLLDGDPTTEPSGTAMVVVFAAVSGLVNSLVQKDAD